MLKTLHAPANHMIAIVTRLTNIMCDFGHNMQLSVALELRLADITWSKFPPHTGPLLRTKDDSLSSHSRYFCMACKAEFRYMASFKLPRSCEAPDVWMEALDVRARRAWTGFAGPQSTGKLVT